MWPRGQVAVFGSRPFPYPEASAHFDFVRRRYFWAGVEHREAEFTTFTNPSFGTQHLAGLTPIVAGTVTELAFSALGLAFPLCMAAVFMPTAMPGLEAGLVTVDDNVANTNSVHLSHSTVPGARSVVRTATVVVATLNSTNPTAGLYTRNAVAGNYETNNILASLNGGANGFVADTVAGLPAGLTTVRFGKRIQAATELLGTLRHGLFFSGARTQGQLDAITANLARY
jgi:hypothetical protein